VVDNYRILFGRIHQDLTAYNNWIVLQNPGMENILRALTDHSYWTVFRILVGRNFGQI
jgi:hypothetical protein